MKFNWKLILQPNTVIHCDTEAKANSLLSEVEGWNNNYWKYYKDQTCYNIYPNAYGRLEYYKDKNYTILTYEDVLLKGENDMKRINKNYYKDGLRVTYEDDYIRIFKQFGTFILFDLFIGKDNLTFEQANEMLKPFGIIIEPKSTDWSKVEVGAKICIINNQFARAILKFKEYIPQTSQIIVFNGNKVEVYNEDEVELI